MLGKQTELTYQLASQTSNSMGGFSTIWYGVRKIKGNLMLEMGVNAFREPFVADKKENSSNYVFITRKIIGLTISSKGRFIEEKTGRKFEIMVSDNPGEVNFSTEIYLKEII